MKKKVIIISIIMGIIILIFTISSTYGRYAYNSLWNSYITSKGFYFGSLSLSKDNKINTDNQWNGQDFKVDVNNFISDNEISSFDISFTSSCEVIEGSGTCQIDTPAATLSSFGYCQNNIDRIDASSYSKAKCESSGYTWINEKSSKTLTVNLTGASEYAKVKLTVNATSPYKETLMGTFILNKDTNITNPISKTYESSKEISSLVISSSYNEEKCFNLKWDNTKAKIIYDEDKYLSNNSNLNDYIDEVKFRLSKKDNIIMEFYEESSEALTSEDFLITETSC